MVKKIKFLIIGCGISGLHLGALLSQHGKTLILEKSHEIGGRAKVKKIKGFQLDFGLHPIRFGPKSALGRSLNQLNCPIEFIKPGKSWVYTINGERELYPTGGIRAVLRSKLIPSIRTLQLLLKIKRMDKAEFQKIYDVSLSDWFIQEKIDLKIQRFLKMTSSAIQVNPFPERSSIGELLQNIKRVLEMGSIYYPKGGWGEIFIQLNKKLKNNGDIRLNSQVTEIIIKNNKAIGVKTNEETILADFVISSIPVQNLFTILDESLCDEDFVKKCKNLRPTAGISIDFGLSQRISDIDGMIFFEGFLGFGYIPSNLSPEITPTESSLMTFLTITNLEDIKNKKRAEEIYKEFRKVIISHFPEIEQYLLFERPLFLEMIDGVEVNIEQHQLKRPSYNIKGIQNLYLTGDSVGGEGAGGDVGHTSVRECYNKILKETL